MRQQSIRSGRRAVAGVVLHLRSVVAATATAFSAGVITWGLLGCNDLLGNQQLPAGTVNPSNYSTPAGALGMRTQALYQLEQALPSYAIHTGLLTDELQSNNIGVSPGVVLVSQRPEGGMLDARILPEATYGQSSYPADEDYQSLQIARANINQALGAIAAYDTGRTAIGDPRVLRAELYALQGYTEILLADFFCSGVPLSTLDFGKDFTYHASSTMEEVYQDAIAKEDSALALADTSTQVQNLARVLKGRALLALNPDSASVAAAVVAQVPDDFRYELSVPWTSPGGVNLLNAVATVSDREGGTGLPYISSNDPRMATVNTVSNRFDVQLTFPARHNLEGFSPFSVADGIEARLIQAEAAYRSGNTTGMLLHLNQLRTTAMVFGQTTPVSDASDALTDPGSDSARVALLFQERAYWLFVTGHRQGDLRRLLRQYSQWYRTADQVYPTGQYPALGASAYGTDVTAPIPGNEYINPLFHGCLDRDA